MFARLCSIKKTERITKKFLPLRFFSLLFRWCVLCMLEIGRYILIYANDVACSNIDFLIFVQIFTFISNIKSIVMRFWWLNWAQFQFQIK